MRTILRTTRVRAGLYVTLDGNWRIQRVPRLFGGRKVWLVEQLQSDRWQPITTFYSLTGARAYIQLREQPWAQL